MRKRFYPPLKCGLNIKCSLHEMFSLNGDQWQVCKVGVHDEKKAFKIGDIRKKIVCAVRLCFYRLSEVHWRFLLAFYLTMSPSLFPRKQLAATADVFGIFYLLHRSIKSIILFEKKFASHIHLSVLKYFEIFM